MNCHAQESMTFQTKAPVQNNREGLLIRSNVLPWVIGVPNLGLEFGLAPKWSMVVDAWYCPWKVSDKYSLKTVALMPEFRFWLRSNRKGSFFDIHFNAVWYNARFKDYRYQDISRPLLGGGIGYGYRLEIGSRWGVEFEIGAGMANLKYQRFYNVENGAAIDTRITTYWGIDRAAITFTYYICDL